MPKRKRKPGPPEGVPQSPGAQLTKSQSKALARKGKGYTWQESHQGLWMARFLELYVKYGGNVTKACRMTPIHFTTAYGMYRRNAKFRQKWNRAKKIANQSLISEAIRRGMSGTRKPVFYKGEICGYVREYSDGLLMFMMKANMPKLFREQLKFDVEGKVEHEHKALSNEQRATRLATLLGEEPQRDRPVEAAVAESAGQHSGNGHAGPGDVCEGSAEGPPVEEDRGDPA